jgi:hypothetical protein
LQEEKRKDFEYGESFSDGIGDVESRTSNSRRVGGAESIPGHRY